MKPVLMIHEVDDKLFELPLEQYTLTFDDGLYTQYKYIDKLTEIQTEKIFYISSGIVCEEPDKQSCEFIKCSEAHDKVFKYNNKENYMTWDQIKDVETRPRCHIGAHSHSHQTFRCGLPTLKYIINDTNMMLKTFDKMLGFIPEQFCFPYNYTTELYENIVNIKGFKTKLSTNRIDVMDLLLNRITNSMGITINEYKWTCT